MQSLRRVLSRYNFWSILYLIRCLIYTRVFFKNAKIIRLPFDIRGKQFVHVGKGFTTGKYCRLEVIRGDGNNTKGIRIGNNVQINDNVHIASTNEVVIEDNVLIASKVFISDHNHGNYSSEVHIHDSPLTAPIERDIYGFPVMIKKNVWIGEFVSILPGVTIGEGPIIGTMSVVNTDIPAYTIAVGVPAKVIKAFNFQSKRWERVQIKK